MNRSLLAVVCFASMLLLSGIAGGAEDRRALVLEDRAKMSADSSWFYNDLQTAMHEARTSGKPLMVVLRCVP